MSGAEWQRASEVTALNLGDRIVSSAGVEIEVLGIRLCGIHLQSSTVLVRYAYNDNGRRGVEEVALGNFINNIHS